MNQLKSVTTNTLDGEFHIIFDENNIARVSGFGTLEKLVERLPKELRNTLIEFVAHHPYQKLVKAYYAGDGTALGRIPYSREGSNFQRKVWQAIGTVPYGKTTSYKELTAASGSPAAVRSVATICGLNRLVLLVPCHRVIRRDGSLGNYFYGSTIKCSLIRRECNSRFKF